MTKTQIDKLGERLRAGPVEDAEKRLLDEYRGSFTPAYERAFTVIGEKLQLAPTGRIKSNASIIEKLRRQKNMALSRMQDIAGCRVVVNDILAQDSFVSSLLGEFGSAKIIDRRTKPSHGYRAV